MAYRTQGPWHVGSAERGVWVSGPDDHENVICEIVGRCDDGSGGGVTDEDRANAEFIVRACNCHDRLLAALRDMMNVQDSTDDCWCCENNQTCEACRCRAAIAEAEGRP